MKAAICYEPGKTLAVEDGVTVDPPGQDEVKVRIAVTAVCHSDLHFIKGEIPFKPPGLPVMKRPDISKKWARW